MSCWRPRFSPLPWALTLRKLRGRIDSIMLQDMRQLETLKFPEKPLPAGLMRLSSLAVFALGWELLARRLGNLLLPTFTETMSALAQLIRSPELWEAMLVSNQAMVLGFALASSVGILFGMLIGRWRSAERYLDPYLSILLVTPKSALMPLVIMAAGLGLPSRVLVTFSYAVVAITVNVRAGVRGIDPDWIEMARSFGASELQVWRKVLLRGALPAIVTGLRLGLARSVSGMVTLELTFIALGLGRLLLDFEATLRSASLYATVLVVIAEAVLLLQAFEWLERWMAPWAHQGVAE
jgi:ABC-type nitrate/sulfonate/bicarbonate transport system permease component